MSDPLSVTAEQERDLKIARGLIEAGIAIFAAPPCKGPHCKIDGHSGEKGQYDFPKNWQLTIPAIVNLERWRPGWALAMVGGRVADVLDVDTYNGGDISLAELRSAGHMPRVFGEATSASGGSHFIISATGEPECNGFMPGLDLQSGTKQPNSQGGHSRAFAWIAPTVRPSKVTGELTPYRWVREPDTDALLEWIRTDGESSDESVQGVIDRVRAYRATKNKPRQAVTECPDDPFISPSRAFDQLFDAATGGGDGRRTFTGEQMEAFIAPALAALREAPIGSIEERGMAATLAVEHFVPAFLTAEAAYERVTQALRHTAYDGRTWTSDKFLARLDGRRPVLGSWKAEAREGHVPALTSGATPHVPHVPPTTDAVDALIAEMLHPAAIISRPPPEPLILGLYNLDSESWIIGKPGCKKSFVVLDQVAHVANGRPWQGLPVTRTRCVMIVAEGAGGLGARMRAWEEAYGPMGDEVYVLPRPVQSGAPQAWAVLVEACRRLRPGFVVVDTQARVTVGLEENNATDMGIFISAIGAIREATGACVLTVHHTGRTGGDARGSSAIDGAQSTELTVETDGLVGRLRTTKQKDMEEAPDMPLSFRVVDLGVDERGNPLSSLVLNAEPGAFDRLAGQEEPEEWEVGHGPAQVQLLKVLRDQGGTIGLTKAEARMAMVQRFHGGEVKALAKTTFYTAWTKVLEKCTAEGEAVVTGVGGAKFAVNTLALEVMVAHQ